MHCKHQGVNGNLVKSFDNHLVYCRANNKLTKTQYSCKTMCHIMKSKHLCIFSAFSSSFLLSTSSYFNFTRNKVDNKDWIMKKDGFYDIINRIKVIYFRNSNRIIYLGNWWVRKATVQENARGDFKWSNEEQSHSHARLGMRSILVILQKINSKFSYPLVSLSVLNAFGWAMKVIWHVIRFKAQLMALTALDDL